MKYVVWGLVGLLVVLHQDLWNWHDDTLVFGFLPMGLFYHACISVAASAEKRSRRAEVKEGDLPSGCGGLCGVSRPEDFKLPTPSAKLMRMHLALPPSKCKLALPPARSVAKSPRRRPRARPGRLSRRLPLEQ